VGFEARDLPRKGLGDVMIALMIFVSYVLVCCCGAIDFHYNSQDRGLWLLIVLASCDFVVISHGVDFVSFVTTLVKWLGCHGCEEWVAYWIPCVYLQ